MAGTEIRRKFDDAVMHCVSRLHIQTVATHNFPLSAFFALRTPANLVVSAYYVGNNMGVAVERLILGLVRSMGMVNLLVEMVSAAIHFSSAR